MQSWRLLKHYYKERHEPGQRHALGANKACQSCLPVAGSTKHANGHDTIHLSLDSARWTPDFIFLSCVNDLPLRDNDRGGVCDLSALLTLKQLIETMNLEAISKLQTTS